MLASISNALKDANKKLSQVTDVSVLESELLLAFTLQQPRSFLHAWPEKELTQDQFIQFSEYLQRRCNKEPLAYITGLREFWSLELAVTRDTLIPRPETELLVESILHLFSTKNRIKMADLGTGSGAIALALGHEQPDWEIHAVDISKKALLVAQYNAQQLGIQNILFHHGSWCATLSEYDFDIIVSNPPYIAEQEWSEYGAALAFEPRNALISGEDGLDDIREIVQVSRHYLKPHGHLFIEHGFLQGPAVRKIFAINEYTEIETVRDLAGRERFTKGQL